MDAVVALQQLLVQLQRGQEVLAAQQELCNGGFVHAHGSRHVHGRTQPRGSRAPTATASTPMCGARPGAVLALEPRINVVAHIALNSNEDRACAQAVTAQLRATKILQDVMKIIYQLERSVYPSLTLLLDEQVAKGNAKPLSQ